MPGGLSVMGYDDIALGALPHIELTSVGQDAARFAREALACAEHRVEHPTRAARDEVITPYLVARSSTARVGENGVMTGPALAHESPS